MSTAEQSNPGQDTTKLIKSSAASSQNLKSSAAASSSQSPKQQGQSSESNPKPAEKSSAPPKPAEKSSASPAETYQPHQNIDLEDESGGSRSSSESSSSMSTRELKRVDARSCIISRTNSKTLTTDNDSGRSPPPGAVLLKRIEAYSSIVVNDRLKGKGTATPLQRSDANSFVAESDVDVAGFVCNMNEGVTTSPNPTKSKATTEKPGSTLLPSSSSKSATNQQQTTASSSSNLQDQPSAAAAFRVVSAPTNPSSSPKGGGGSSASTKGNVNVLQ